MRPCLASRSAFACPSATTRIFLSRRCCVPARLRGAVVAIYRFARAADDIADEGDATPAERHRRARRASSARSTRSQRATRPPSRRSPRSPRRSTAHALPIAAVPRPAVRVPPGRRRPRATRRSPTCRLLPPLGQSRSAACCSRCTRRCRRQRRAERRDLHGAAADQFLAGRRASTGARAASTCRTTTWRASASTTAQIARRARATRAGAR